jgi:hypothetical protein
MIKLTESQLIERATALRSKLNELSSFDQEKANQKNPAKSAEQPDTSFFSDPFANISQRNKAANNTQVTDSKPALQLCGSNCYATNGYFCIDQSF